MSLYSTANFESLLMIAASFGKRISRPRRPES